MAQAVNICVEADNDTIIQEISYDGTEIIKP